MIRTITVRGLTVGAGRTKIIAPIVDTTKEEILRRAESFQNRTIDMAEWRADNYQDVFNTTKVLETLAQLRRILSIPLLFTFRTRKEGGAREISMPDYIRLNGEAARSGNVDLVDVEIFSEGGTAKECIAAVHAAGVLVVGSNHDFLQTPSRADLVYRLRKMQDMGADIPKIAVMPNCVEDVLTLLSATAEMNQYYADRPIITMSMSAAGVISRLSCEAFGSAMTFGSAGQGSAPGQIPVEQLNQVVEVLHRSLSE